VWGFLSWLCLVVGVVLLAVAIVAAVFVAVLTF
jgi:hypothetical protein